MSFVRLCNFDIPRYTAIYQFDQPEIAPQHMIVVRQLIDPKGSGTIYLAANDEHRSPDMEGYLYFEAEVCILLEALKTQSDVVKVFQRSHAQLNPFGLNPANLLAYLGSFKTPPTTSVITSFGKQPDGTWVLGNVCFKDGLYMSHAEAKKHILPQYFLNMLNPIAQRNYPKILQCPIPHVRYVIGLEMWKVEMPKFFRSNELHAKIVFVLGIMGLAIDLFWAGGSGMGKQFPCGWLWSNESGTGKSEATYLIHSLLGGGHNPLLGGDTTKAAMMERLAASANMLVVIDDVENTGVGGIGETLHTPKYLKETMKAVCDHQNRSVLTKDRTAKSPLVFSSNYPISNNELSLHSRLLTLHFKPVKSGAAEWEQVDGNAYATWGMKKELCSVLMVDFETLHLEDGKLDSWAMQDCSNFLTWAVTGSSANKEHNRNTNFWGVVLYYLLLINAMFQSTAEEQERTIEHILKEVRGVHHKVQKHSGYVDRFILSVHKLRADCGTMIANALVHDSTTVIFWHNFRANVGHPGSHHRYIALRLEACCNVIQKQLKIQMPYEELKDALKVWGAIEASKGFYSIGMGWPCEIVEEAALMGGPPTRRARTEAELDGFTVKYPCIIIQQEKWDQIVESAENGGVNADDVSWKEITFKSANPHIEGNFNFFDCVTFLHHSGKQFYRVLGNCTFKHFCGAHNVMKVPIASLPTPGVYVLAEIEQMHKDMKLPSVARHFEPSFLIDFFKYHSVREWDELPPCYANYPFGFEWPTDDLPDALESYPDYPGSSGPARNGPPSPVSDSSGTPVHSKQASPDRSSSFSDLDDDELEFYMGKDTPKAVGVNLEDYLLQKSKAIEQDSKTPNPSQKPIGEEHPTSMPKRKKRSISFLDENHEMEGDPPPSRYLVEDELTEMEGGPPPSLGDPGSIPDKDSNERGQDSLSGPPTTDDESAHADWSPGGGIEVHDQPAEVRHPPRIYAPIDMLTHTPFI